MAIFHDVGQGTIEWFNMRLGVATASCFDKIITPKTGELSKQCDDYANQLIGEMITGETAEKFPQTYWMERGAQLEGDAAAAYEAITDFTLDMGGFMTNDDLTIGASPDRRVFGPDGRVVGGVEIKCPAPATHIANLLRHDKIDPSYIPQVQGQMYVCGFDFIDWFSYHPDMPPAHIRTYRDDDFCEKLEDCLNNFMRIVEMKIDTLKSKGVIVPERPIVRIYKERNDFETFNPMMAG